MKVLSIDWDYFIDASANERATLFPDGGNEEIPPFLRNIIWATHYNDKLRSIGIKENDYNVMKELIANNFEKIMIADSHKHIYEFITDDLEDDEIDVYNIDFHHDLYGINNIRRQDVDCGNWMVKLFDEFDCNYFWINQEDSDKKLENENFCDLKEMKIEDLKKESFDVLYICRSSVWSPPHLDKYFIEAFCPLLEQTEIPVTYETDIMEDRYNEDLQKMAAENEAMMNQFKKEIEEKDENLSI